MSRIQPAYIKAFALWCALQSSVFRSPMTWLFSRSTNEGPRVHVLQSMSDWVLSGQSMFTLTAQSCQCSGFSTVYFQTLDGHSTPLGGATVERVSCSSSEACFNVRWYLCYQVPWWPVVRESSRSMQVLPTTKLCSLLRPPGPGLAFK